MDALLALGMRYCAGSNRWYPGDTTQKPTSQKTIWVHQSPTNELEILKGKKQITANQMLLYT